MTEPLTPNPAATAFLRGRRSRPAKTLTAPGPGPEALVELLTLAARTPDHGKLEPWRFVVLGDAAMARIAELTQARGVVLGIEADKIAKAVEVYRSSPGAVVVVESPKPSDKVPGIEQTYSAGAVCLALVNAALAAGWGANWLSGWASHDPVFCAQAFDLAPQERVAGIIHIGTETSAPPDRPRPDIAALTTWMSS